MKETKILLREQFEAETNISVNKDSKNWKLYSEWLEQLKSDDINNDIVIENNFLKDKMYKAMNIFYEGISAKPKIENIV